MTVKLKPLARFAVEAFGLEMDVELAQDDVRSIGGAIDKHAVLVFRDQPLDQHQVFKRRVQQVRGGTKLHYRTHCVSTPAWLQ